MFSKYKPEQTSAAKDKTKTNETEGQILSNFRSRMWELRGVAKYFDNSLKTSAPMDRNKILTNYIKLKTAITYILDNADQIGFQLKQIDRKIVDYIDTNIKNVETAILKNSEFLPTIFVPNEDIENLLFSWGEFEEARR